MHSWNTSAGTKAAEIIASNIRVNVAFRATPQTHSFDPLEPADNPDRTQILPRFRSTDPHKPCLLRCPREESHLSKAAPSVRTTRTYVCVYACRNVWLFFLVATHRRRRHADRTASTPSRLCSKHANTPTCIPRGAPSIPHQSNSL